MKKKVVITSVVSGYIIGSGTVGKDLPKDHPYFNSIIRTKEFSFVKKGDILRCDGLPFMSRPKPIKTIEYNMDTNGFILHRTRSLRESITHKPVQLPTSLWVLRPVENI